jgi:TolB-like protein
MNLFAQLDANTNFEGSAIPDSSRSFSSYFSHKAPDAEEYNSAWLLDFCKIINSKRPQSPAANQNRISNLTDAHRSFAVGDWLVEPSLNRISTTFETIHLRAQVMQVLVYLADLDGQVATLESIHDNLWSGKVVSSGTIYNCIAELRQAFATGGSNLEYIETLPKKGYRLAPPIVSRQAAADSSHGRFSIAVLPLINRSDDPDVEYLCAGISDEILHGMSKVRGLNVYSASSLQQEHLDARVVGLRFGAQMVLSGSLQAGVNKLRAMFRLENVSDGEIVWSGRFDQSMEDLFELQDTVAREVVGALAPLLPIAPSGSILLEGSGTSSLDALNAFLLGRHALSKSTQESQDEAIDCFLRAVRTDPSFARAHYLLYLANYMKCRHFGTDVAALEDARVAANKAMECGFRPAVPWVHIHRRLYPDSRLSSRELALEAIDKLKEQDTEWGSFAYEQLTWVLADAGLFTATLDFAKHVLASPDHNFEDSDVDEEVPHYTAACGYFDEAIRLWSSLIQKEPTRPLFRCERSILYSLTGQFDYASMDIDSIATQRHLILAKAFLAFYQDRLRDTLRHHEALLAMPYVHPTYRLWTFCMTGDIDAGLEAYAEAVNDQSRSFIDFGNVRAMSRAKLPAAVVEELERHPGFQDLLDKEGIDDAWQAELVQRLNDVSNITGITVKPDR